MVQATRKFVEMLLSGTTHPLWVSSLPNERGAGGERHVRTRDVKTVLEFCAKWDVADRGTFYCVSTIDGHRRCIETAAETKILWVDVDLKDIELTQKQVLKVLRKLPVQPRLVNLSGHGLHPIWELSDPIRGDHEPLLQVLRSLCRLLGGDRHVCHPAALLRMPGTHNTKDGGRIPVRTIECGQKAVPALEVQLWLSGHNEVLVPRRSRPEDPFRQFAEEKGIRPPVDAEARLRAMRWKGPGDTAIHATQLAVTASLLEAGLGAEEVVERVLDATREAVDGRPDWNWDAEERGLENMCASWVKKHPAEEPRRGRPRGNGGTGEVISLAAVRAERGDKKARDKNTHGILGQGLLDTLRERGEQILYESGRLHRYRDGLWSALKPKEEQEWLNTEAESGCQALKIVSRNSLRSEVRGWVQAQKILRRDGVPWDEHNKIATQSGLIDPTTLAVEPLRPEHYVTHRVECEYDRKARCPLWEQMLADCLPNQKTVRIIQEVAGAALVPWRSRELRRGLVLTGPSNTGKSSLITVIAGMLSTSSNSTPFDMFENAHGTSSFLQPAPWVLHEAFDQSKWHFSATVKALLSADLIQVNEKGNPQMIPLRYRAAVLWATNFPPQFREASRALQHRLLIVKMHHVFEEDALVGAAAEARRRGCGSAAELILSSERSGWLNWALTGWRRLAKRGYFEQTEEMLQAAHEMHLEHNMVAAMVEELVEFDAETMVAAADFHAALATWWRDGHSEKVPVPAAVGRALAALDDRVGVDKRELRFNGRRYYAGVKLNADGLEAWEVYKRVGGLDLQTSDEVSTVNREVPPQWVVKDIIKRIRKAHRK